LELKGISNEFYTQKHTNRVLSLKTAAASFRIQRVLKTGLRKNASSNCCCETLQHFETGQLYKVYKIKPTRPIFRGSYVLQDFVNKLCKKVRRSEVGLVRFSTVAVDVLNPMIYF